ncbi:hypothetical protein OB905_13505 [Halobacteria archaeon AArc-dxtr1]|nr:hypothetical protein [Halobacteria archaeon AArc-dxtr1]
MSNRSPLSNETITPSSTDADRHESRFHLQKLKRPAQFLSFWLAIALPFVHLPLLTQGLGDLTTLVAFLVLLSVNVVALYVGHGYKQS